MKKRKKFQEFSNKKEYDSKGVRQDSRLFQQKMCYADANDKKGKVA